MSGTEKKSKTQGRRKAKRKQKKFEWSKILTAWVLLLNSFVVYHGIHLCYVMIEHESTSYSFGWLATLISVVVGLGNIVITAYMAKSGSENKEKIKQNGNEVVQDNANYP